MIAAGSRWEARIAPPSVVATMIAAGMLWYRTVRLYPLVRRIDRPVPWDRVDALRAFGQSKTFTERESVSVRRKLVSNVSDSIIAGNVKRKYAPPFA